MNRSIDNDNDLERWKALGTITIIALVVSFVNGCGSQRTTTPQGAWHKVRQGQLLSRLCERYQSNLDDVIEINGLKNPDLIIVGRHLFFPHRKRYLPAKVPKIRDVSLQAYERTLLKVQWPLFAPITSGFGPRKGRPHKGIDLAAPAGTKVYAALDGKVSRSEFNQGGYGWLIVIDHGKGVETRYAHHQKNMVKVGDQVSQGQSIALVGSTGRSSGPHLHFELRYRGKALDPLLYLPAINRTVSHGYSKKYFYLSQRF